MRCPVLVTLHFFSCTFDMITVGRLDPESVQACSKASNKAMSWMSSGEQHLLHSLSLVESLPVMGFPNSFSIRRLAPVGLESVKFTATAFGHFEEFLRNLHVHRRVLRHEEVDIATDEICSDVSKLKMGKVPWSRPFSRSKPWRSRAKHATWEGQKNRLLWKWDLKARRLPVKSVSFA